jgi:hypothetical protein
MLKTVDAQGSPLAGPLLASYTIWPSSTRPARIAGAERARAELGLKFRSTSNGWITAVRYYRSPQMKPSTFGRIWSADGRLLASARFERSTRSGWQVARLDSPVGVVAGRTYVTSYTAEGGHYGIDEYAFGNGRTVNRGALTALAGVYTYSSGMPRDTWKHSNYYADVQFRAGSAAPATVPAESSSPTTVPPTVAAESSPPTTVPPTVAADSSPPTSSPTMSPPTTTGAPSTTSSSSPSTTDPDAYVVGTGANAMLFPEKPGLITSTAELRPYSGPTTVTGNYSESNCVVTKQIRVEVGGHLSLNNCWIKVNVGDASYGMVGKKGEIDISHSLIDSTGIGTYVFPLIIEGGGNVTYSEFIGGTDNARLSSNTRFEWNYIHNPKVNAKDAHSDGIEIYYGAREGNAPSTGPHILILNNYIDIGTAAGAAGDINLTNDFGPIDGVRIEGNTLMPGNINLYLRGDGYCQCGGNLRNIEVINNRFFASHAFYPDGYNQVVSYKPATGVTRWEGNTFIDPSGRSTPFGLSQL